MPGSVIAETTRPGKLIQFTEDDHKYVLKDKRTGEVQQAFTSVTTMIGEYFPKFDAEGQSLKSAAKEGGTEEEIRARAEELRAKWKAAGDEASEYGTRVHEYLEDLVRGRKPRNIPRDEREQTVFALGAKFVWQIKPKLELIEPEKIVCDPEWGLAGTIDVLAKDPKADRMIIMDWKTNKKIDMDTVFGKYGFGPIAHIPDCEFGHYALQLNTYEAILKHAGYIGRDVPVLKYLIHLHKDNGLRVLQVPDRQREVIALIEDFQRKRAIQ